VQAARQRLASAGCAVPGIEARTRYGWIREKTAGCVQRPAERPVTWTDRLDRVLTHKVWGTLVFLVLMFVVFQSIFTWAEPLMNWIGAGRDWLGGVVGKALGPGPLSSLLVDGVIKGVGAVVVFLPQIIILFGFIAILEDCGYMARAAFLMDRLMARAGLSGKSFIPMLSSVACAVPGIMATRVIENRRDRLATILVAPLMSCSARLPVYILLIGTFFPVRTEENPDGYGWWTPGW
jgi:ferrous iron transport protein B